MLRKVSQPGELTSLLQFPKCALRSDVLSQIRGRCVKLKKVRPTTNKIIKAVHQGRVKHSEFLDLIPVINWAQC